MRAETLFPTEFEHDEFTIRKFDMYDGEDLSDAANASYEQIRDWMPWAKPVLSIGEAEDLCIRFEDEHHAGKDFALGVWDEKRKFLGGAFFHPTGNEREAAIDLWVRSTLADKGFGTRILEALIEWGFREWDFDRLIVRCPYEAPAFQRIAEKAGLDFIEVQPQAVESTDGRKHDARVYAITKETWRASF